MSEPSIQELFNRIVALPPEEREDALRLLDVEHPAHAARIRRLLPFHQPLAEEPTLSSPGDFGAEVESYVGDEDDPPRALPEIAGFQIVEPLDHGGQSTVYLATQSNPKRRVAIKVMRSSILDARAQARFLAEAEVQGTIRHPAIVGVHACGVHDAKGRPLSWIAMELVPGARNIIEAARADRWDRRRRLEALATVADAIQAAHLRGVIHRDVKPGNVLVDQDGHVRVIDFGIARVIDSTESLARTREGEVLGTLKHIAPEQLDGSVVDARADVYALGTLAFELLHGRSPYGDLRSFAAFYAAIQRHEIDQPQARTRADRDLNAVLAKALARTPAARYESMAAFARDLRSLAAANRVDARPRGTLDELQRLAIRHPIPATLSVLLAVAVLIGIGIAVWLLDRADAFKDRQLLLLASVAIQQGDYELAERRIAEVEKPRWTPHIGHPDLSFPLELLRSQLERRHLESHQALEAFGNRYEAAIVNGSARQILAACGGHKLTLIGLPEHERARDLTLMTSQNTPFRGEVLRMSVDSTPSSRLTFATVDTTGSVMLFDASREELLDLETDVRTLSASKDVTPPTSEEDPSSGRHRGILITDRVLILGDSGGRLEIRPLIRTNDADARFDDFGDPITIRSGLDGFVTAIASSPESAFWIVGTSAGEVAMIPKMPISPSWYMPPLLEPRKVLPDLDHMITRVAMSPDGRHFAACGARHVVSGTLDDMAVTPGIDLQDSGAVWGLSFSPDNERLAITGRSGTVRLVRTSDWSTTAVIDETAGVTWSTAWHFDDVYVTTERSTNSPDPVGEGILILRKDARTLLESRPTRRHGGHGDANAELILADGDWYIEDQAGMLKLDFDGHLDRLSPESIECVSIRSRPDRTDVDTVMAVIITRDSGLLVVDGDGAVRLRAPREDITHHGESVHEIRVSSDGSLALWRNSISDIWGLDLRADAARPGVIRIEPRSGSPEDADRTAATGIFDWPDGDEGGLVVGTNDGRLLRITMDGGSMTPMSVWDPAQRDGFDPVDAPGWILAFVHDPITDTSYAGSQNGRVSKWNAERREPDWGVGRRRSMIRDIVPHPGSEFIVTLDSRGIIEVLDVDDGAPLVTLGPLPGTPDCLSLRDGVLTAHATDGSYLRWEPASGEDRVLP
ncbi:MAG: hypothetical protein RLZZ461_859 [Planctomycetota bacterium]|jgi:tRNA A-37 threonylcarbamoyl transferase component Bud32/WD40 repeat protein